MLTDSGLDTYLRKHTAQEEQNLLGATNDYPGIETITTASGELCYCFTPTPLSTRMALSENRVLANYHNFAVIKQDRFETVPLHIHEWLELCYVYSGSCTFTLNDVSLSLSAGEILLISPNTPHRTTKCNEDDILINFLITKEYLTGNFFEKLAEKNFITQFLIEALNSQSQQDNYILFSAKTKKRNRLTLFANQFLCEFYSPSVTSTTILDAQMTLLICELINYFQHNMELASLSSSNHIYSILRYIETNCASCTLESTAAFFHMHPNYLSSYIKKHTNYTYKQLIQNQRLSQAAMLLRTTTLPTCDISIAVGYENTGFFFKKFEEKYGCTPKEYHCRQTM